MNKRQNDSTELREDILEGRNPVFEALRAGRQVDKILIAKYTDRCYYIDKLISHKEIVMKAKRLCSVILAIILVFALSIFLSHTLEAGVLI